MLEKFLNSTNAFRLTFQRPREKLNLTQEIHFPDASIRIPVMIEPVNITVSEAALAMIATSLYVTSLYGEGLASAGIHLLGLIGLYIGGREVARREMQEKYQQINQQVNDTFTALGAAVTYVETDGLITPQ